MTTKQAGDEGFHWFFGIVEDRDDPLQLGRVRVRCYNLHTHDKTVMPTENLPWATPIQSVTSAASLEIGVSPTGIIVGTTVFGFFADNGESQIPMILGTLAGIPKKESDGKYYNDVAQRARGIDNVINEPIPDIEPPLSYKGKYPYVQTVTSESEDNTRHILEVDATPGGERLFAAHKKGTYVEIDPDGRIVIKGVANSFFLTVKDSVVYTGGNCTIVVVGDSGIAIGGNATIHVAKSANCWIEGDLTANVGGNLQANVAKDSTIDTVGTTLIHSKGNLNLESDDSINIKAGNQIKLKAPRIDLN